MVITIIGRRWFQKTYGNTYHTAQIMIDGVTVHKTGSQYGYNDQYRYTAWEWITANRPDVPAIKRSETNGSYEAFWQYSERTGVNLNFEGIDVSRQKDL